MKVKRIPNICLTLRKRHCKLSTRTQLKINEHEFVTSDSDILAEGELSIRSFTLPEELQYHLPS